MPNWLNTLSKLGRRLSLLTRPPGRKRHQTQFICSTPVIWETGQQFGEAVLREVNSNQVRLRMPQALLAGKCIRVRPLDSGETKLVKASGTVRCSRIVKGGYEVLIELSNPKELSIEAWSNQANPKAWGEEPLSQPSPWRAARFRVLRKNQKNKDTE